MVSSIILILPFLQWIILLSARLHKFSDITHRTDGIVNTALFEDKVSITVSSPYCKIYGNSKDV